MIEIAIHVPGRAQAVPQLVERVCTLEGLEISLKGSLARYPGSVHWHFKKGKQSGTLELTWWPRENRLWFKIAAGRAGSPKAGGTTWIDAIVEGLREKIEQALWNAQ
jgi:hypothetical protein